MSIQTPSGLSRKEVSDLWDQWVDANPDPFSSVQRSLDPGQLDLVVPDILEKLRLTERDSLLDVGCGSGILLDRLKSKIKFEAVGVDVSEKQIELAKKTFPDLTFRTAGIESLPFDRESFHKILCYGVLMYAEDWRVALDELLRVCRSKGLILLGDVPCSHLRFWFYVTKLEIALHILRRFKEWMRFRKSFITICPWKWISLGDLTAYLCEKGHQVEVRTQPRNLQWGSKMPWDTTSFRRDVIIRKK